MPTYLDPTQESGRLFFLRGIQGSVAMLNLLRYRTIADYSASPELAPASPITGEAAYRLYMEHTKPHLERSGGKVLFFGRGGSFLVGPKASAGMRCCWCSKKAHLRSWRSRRILNTWLASATGRPRWRIRACCPYRKKAGNGRALRSSNA